MSLKHMRTLIILVVGLLSVGCGNSAEKKVVGEYEYKEDGDTDKLVFLENGVYKLYLNGKKQDASKWSIVDGEIHLKAPPLFVFVWRINKDKSLTEIANIDRDGKRTDISDQSTYKKIK
jgi:hypothetical protein